MPDYFRSSTNRAARKRAGKVLTDKIHNEFSEVFQGIGYFEGTFSLQEKDGSQSYQAPHKGRYTLQKPIKEELERIQRQ